MALNVGKYDWPGIHHLWSVAIEEQFYMLWPLIIALAPLAQLRRICGLLIVGSVACKFLLVAIHAPWTAVYVSSIGRLEGLALGAFIATLSQAEALHWRRWIRLGGLLGIAGLLAMIATGAQLMSKLTLLWAIPAATAAFGWLLFAIHTGSLPAALKTLLSGSTLAWFGRYSYGLYLCHYAIYWCVRPLVPLWFGRDPAIAQANDVVLVTGIVALLLSMLYARLMFALIEAPALRLRERGAQRGR
ncbi:MAG TPA: acyltransferase, partial [Fontimonas sp.]